LLGSLFGSDDHGYREDPSVQQTIQNIQASTEKLRRANQTIAQQMTREKEAEEAAARERQAAYDRATKDIAVLSSKHFFIPKTRVGFLEELQNDLQALQEDLLEIPVNKPLPQALQEDIKYIWNQINKDQKALTPLYRHMRKSMDHYATDMLHNERAKEAFLLRTELEAHAAFTQTKLEGLDIIILVYTLFQIIICFASNNNEVMDLDKFINVLNQDPLLIKYNKTSSVLPLNKCEVLMIEEAKRNEYRSYGGLFDKNRHIDKFIGECLFIGGGKLSGTRGKNDGITVLINIENELQQIDEVINKLHSGQWEYDQHTGKKFTTSKEKKDYIKQLKLKKVLYKKAFLLKNQDTLDKFYTLNIEPNVKPDILASITNNYDLRKIPDHRFDNVEFENVPCSVFLDPNLYPNLERITKIGGKINFSISIYLFIYFI